MIFDADGSCSEASPFSAKSGADQTMASRTKIDLINFFQSVRLRRAGPALWDCLMKRVLAPLALLVSLTSVALGQTGILPTPEIRGNDVTVGGVLRLGTRVGGVYTSTPDRLQILGAGSTGDVSAMNATPAEGGVARALTDLFSTQLYAINFGVIPGVADSGPAMRRAMIRAQALGARLILPPGVINVCGGTDPEALLRIELFMDLVGTSQKSRIQPCADAGNRAVLLIKPLASKGGIRGAVLRDFSIGTLGSTRNGGDGIKIDTTNKEGFVAKLLVENLGIASRGTGYYAIHHVNNPDAATGNRTGGLFGSTFRDSDFFGGMKFEQTGDSNNIERNIIAGPNEGIYYNAIEGAATARIVGNNITATGDTIVIDGGQQARILENQLEAVGTYTGGRSQPAVITVIGATDVVIRNNNMNCYTRADAVAALSGAKSVRVEPNTVTYAANKVLFRAVASPGNIVERQAYETIGGRPATGRALVSVDAASPTFGVWQQLTTLNKWIPGNNADFRQGLWWMPLTDGTVRLSGTIMGGAVTPGTPLATFPAGFRPSDRALRFSGMAYMANVVNGPAWGMGVYIVDGRGNITIQSLPPLAAGSFLQFDGSTFSIRP
ncbi:Right handed beta helix domain-containing protein [Methylorubrum thiocyanatum]